MIAEIEIFLIATIATFYGFHIIAAIVAIIWKPGIIKEGAGTGNKMYAGIRKFRPPC